MLIIIQDLCRRSKTAKFIKRNLAEKFELYELGLTTFSICISTEQTSQNFLCEQWKPERKIRGSRIILLLQAFNDFQRKTENLTAV